MKLEKSLTPEVIKEYIENSKQTYQMNNEGINDEMSYRHYHAKTRGLLISQLFKNVEPKGRYVSEYLNEEIVPGLKIGDDGFKVYVKGVDKEDVHIINHIKQPNIVWLMWNLVIPWKTGFCKHIKNIQIEG